MTAIAQMPDDLRFEAARIAFALIRFEETLAHVMQGMEPYIFTPSWRSIPPDDVESFLVGLPSPALLSPTTVRGMIALTLVHELSGDRRRWAEKTLSNFTVNFDELSQRYNLSPASRILLEVNGDTHLLSHAAVRLWTQQFGVQVGWSISPLENDPRAQAELAIRRGDGYWSSARYARR